MSIEQKIAEILAESKVHGKEGGSDSGKDGAVAGDKAPVRKGDAFKAQSPEQNPDNKANDVDQIGRAHV